MCYLFFLDSIAIAAISVSASDVGSGISSASLTTRLSIRLSFVAVFRPRCSLSDDIMTALTPGRFESSFTPSIHTSYVPASIVSAPALYVCVSNEAFARMSMCTEVCPSAVYVAEVPSMPPEINFTV